MKKIIAMTLLLAMTLSVFSGCKKKDGATPGASTDGSALLEDNDVPFTDPLQTDGKINFAEYLTKYDEKAAEMNAFPLEFFSFEPDMMEDGEPANTELRFVFRMDNERQSPFSIATKLEDGKANKLTITTDSLGGVTVASEETNIMRAAIAAADEKLSTADVVSLVEALLKSPNTDIKKNKLTYSLDVTTDGCVLTISF